MVRTNTNTNTNTNIFNSLNGRWEFARTIRNRQHSSLSGWVGGIAVFSPLPNAEEALHYQETGEYITVSGNRTYITQEYLYILTKDGDIAVHFAKNGIRENLFHIIAANEFAQHICVQDKYLVKYDFSQQAFQITYVVEGPKKSYIANTLFKRGCDNICNE